MPFPEWEAPDVMFWVFDMVELTSALLSNFTGKRCLTHIGKEGGSVAGLGRGQGRFGSARGERETLKAANKVFADLVCAVKCFDSAGGGSHVNSGTC